MNMLKTKKGYWWNDIHKKWVRNGYYLNLDGTKQLSNKRSEDAFLTLKTDMSKLIKEMKSEGYVFVDKWDRCFSGSN